MNMVRLPQAGRGSDPPSNPAVLLRQLGETELEVPEAGVTERGLGIRPIFYFFRDREASTITVVKLSRSSGVVLHPTSLPGPYGIGDLGPEAYRFARFVSSSGLGVWQVLPLGPPGFGDSPYQCFSAFAGNPLLISPDLLTQDALLDKADLEERPDFDPARVDFRAVIDFKLPLLERAYRNFKAAAGNQTGSEFKVFCRSCSTWLDDYALFRAVKELHQGAPWTDWGEAIRRRDPASLAQWREKLSDQIQMHCFWQFQFFKQWSRLKQFCADNGVRIMGDLPIFVAHDSADVWVQPELFELDSAGKPVRVAGVPPDYFSETGQLWGNPIYRWERMRQDGYRWWINRFRSALELVDLIRLDHFRGFEAFGAVPADRPDAVSGEWVPGPGAPFFEAVERELGSLPAVAENLGWITPAVEDLRKRFDFPGMGVLQFAFGSDPQASEFIPHNHTQHMVIYSGTHDNDTTMGWWKGGEEETRTRKQMEKERDLARRYLAADGRNPGHWDFLKAVMASVAKLALVPLQDILGLGSEARMNTPGRVSGNWSWRFQADDLASPIRERLLELTWLYGRRPGPRKMPDKGSPGVG